MKTIRKECELSLNIPQQQWIGLVSSSQPGEKSQGDQCLSHSICSSTPDWGKWSGLYDQFQCTPHRLGMDGYDICRPSCRLGRRLARPLSYTFSLFLGSRFALGIGWTAHSFISYWPVFSNRFGVINSFVRPIRGQTFCLNGERSVCLRPCCAFLTRHILFQFYGCFRLLSLLQ